MTNIASLWIGDSLGMIEQASIASFLQYGHKFTLYVYDEVKHIPKGVVVKDAHAIFQSDKIIRHKKTGSPAIHADLFRYAMLAQTDAMWVDLDVIAVRPFHFDSDWVFGLETDDETLKEANIAVLKLPKDAKTLASLLNITANTRCIPPTVTGFRRLKYQVRTLGKGLTVEKWPWGATGPRALTHYLKQHNEFHHAMPQAAFYSVGLSDAEKFLLPNAIDPLAPPDNVWAYHLWGKQLRNILKNKYNNQPPKDSFLDKVLTS